MLSRTAERVCGALKVTVPGEPAVVALRNCKQCFERTGSILGQLASERRHQSVQRKKSLDLPQELVVWADCRRGGDGASEQLTAPEKTCWYVRAYHAAAPGRRPAASPRDRDLPSVRSRPSGVRKQRGDRLALTFRQRLRSLASTGSYSSDNLLLLMLQSPTNSGHPLV